MSICRLQVLLAEFQRKRIQSFEDWLSALEKDMEEFEEKFLGDFDDVKIKLDEVKVCFG